MGNEMKFVLEELFELGVWEKELEEMERLVDRFDLF